MVDVRRRSGSDSDGLMSLCLNDRDDKDTQPLGGNFRTESGASFERLSSTLLVELVVVHRLHTENPSISQEQPADAIEFSR